MKKKIITMLLLGFVLIGSLTVWLNQPVNEEHPIVLEYEEPDPGKKIGG